MNTARCEQGHEKSPRLLLECCPKLTWAGQVGDTKGESHEQIPLAFRAKKKKKRKSENSHFPPSAETWYNLIQFNSLGFSVSETCWL